MTGSVNNERYVNLVRNKSGLIKSSRSMIRKKKSHQARRIAKGDVRAIIRAAKNRIHGSIDKQKREDLCKLLCEFKNKLRKRSLGQTYNEIISWAISGIVGIIDTASGLIISFLWILREKLESVICPCLLDESCHSQSCLSLR